MCEYQKTILTESGLTFQPVISIRFFLSLSVSGSDQAIITAGYFRLFSQGVDRHFPLKLLDIYQGLKYL
jgi:hypothetical protein